MSVTTADIFTTADPASCLAVKVPVEQTTFALDPLAVGLAFLVGLIVGALIALLCAKLCMKDIAKSKYQDAESGYMEQNKMAAHDKQKLVADEDKDQDTPPTKKKLKKRRLKSAKKGGGLGGEDEEPLVPILPVSVSTAPMGTAFPGGAKGQHPQPQGGPGQRGLVNALEKNAAGDIEEEIADQDMEAVNNLERELKEESILTMIQLLRTMLGQQMQKGKMGKDQVQDVMGEIQTGLQEQMTQAQTDKDDKEQELRKSIKDPVKLSEELDKNHSDYLLKLQAIVSRERENARKQLQKKTDLNDDEIDALLSHFANNMAHMEHNLGQERARQAANLEERLQKRRLQLAQKKQDKQLEVKSRQHRSQVTGNMLGALVEDGKLTDRQRDDLLKQYNEDVSKLQAKHDEDEERQKLHLAEKLKAKREERMRQLEEKQREEKEKFLRQSEKGTNPKELLDRYHGFEQQQRDEREEVNDELDQDEADSFNKLAKNKERELNQDLLEKEEAFHANLQSKAGISDADLDRMLRIHQQQMEEFDRQKKEEKRRMKAKMAEKLAQRKAKVESEQAQTLAEQATLKEQQDLTVNNLLNSQVELSADAKEKILREHDQNMAAVNNNLQMSKLRQQKALEARLAKRKARVADLRQKQEDMENSRREGRTKDVEKLEKEIAKQLELEEQALEAERQNALASQRSRLAAETAEALKEQERSLSDTMARLEVGQARRQAIIKKQDKTIKELEDQIASKVADGADHGTNAQIDNIMKDHQNQMAHLDEKLQDAKYRQEQLLKEKLDAKRIKKEREMETKVENEAAEEWQGAKKRGAGLATAIFSQVMLEQRHKLAMEQMESEMAADMQKQLNELNTELEAELQAELAEQKKSFLAQVAAIGKLSKAEVNDLVEEAVADSGGSEKEAKKLAKELRVGMQRAKTELGVDDREDPRDAMRRTRTGYGFDNEGYDEPDRPSRPKSGKPRPRSAFRDS